MEEAPEPAVEEAPAPAKRGRKAKAVVEDMATVVAGPVEAPEPAKRGRRAAAAVENATEKEEKEAEATTSATAGKKTTSKSKTQPKAKNEPKTKGKARAEPEAETKAKAEPKPKAAKAKAESKPSPVKASPKPKKATTKTETASPKESPAKASPRKVPSPIKSTLAVPRASKRAAISAGPVTADYEADESRPATAVLPPAKTAKTKKVPAAAATRGRPKGTAKEKAASPRKAKTSTTKASSSVSARGGRARRAAVEIKEDGGEGKEDEEEDGEEDDDDDMETGDRRATPPRLNYGPVHKLAAWRLTRDAPAAKLARKGRAATAAAGKAAKATISRKRQRDEIAFPRDEYEVDDTAASSPDLHALSLADLQSLVASWSADGASGTESGSASAPGPLIPSGPDHFPQQIATCTSALADIVSTLSEAVLAVQSERHAADALAFRYAKFALWHHERVVRLAERLERELERVGTAADLKIGKGKGKDVEMRGSEMGEGKLAGAMRLVKRIRDWTDDGAMRCGAACQRGEGNCEECGRAEVLPDPEIEEDLPDYEDDGQEDEEEEVVIVVESQLDHRTIEDGDVLQAHQREEDTDRVDPAYAYGQVAALQSAFGGSVPVQPAAARPASARSILSTNGGHRPTAITTASLTYAQPSVSTAATSAPPTSQLRPASMNSNSNSNAPLPAKSALAGLISPISPPYSSGDVGGEVGEYGGNGEGGEEGEDTADDHLYDDLFESEAPMAALSGPLQSYPAQSPISPTNPAYLGVTYPSLNQHAPTSPRYQPAPASPRYQPAPTSPRYQPAHPLHPVPQYQNPTFAGYQPAQARQDPAAMNGRLLNAPPYDDSLNVTTPPCDARPMEEVSYDYQGSLHGANEGVPTFSPVASPE